MIEAELKARVRDPDGLHARLGELAAGERSVYRDAYYDHPAGTWLPPGGSSGYGHRVRPTRRGRC